MDASVAAAASVAGAQLRSIVERIERLEDEKRALADDVRDIYTEAEANGFDKAALREIIRIRRKDPAERDALESLVDLYRVQLGGQP